MKARVPQAAAWEDVSVSFQARAGRFVDVPANAFTDNTLTVEQKVPLNGKNISRAREASRRGGRRLRATAPGGTRRARQRGRGLLAAGERLRPTGTEPPERRALLNEAADLSRARYEAGTQTQADVLAATVERARIVEARADLERARDDAQSALNVLLNRPARSALGQPPALATGDSFAPAPAIGGPTRCPGPGVPTGGAHGAKADRQRAGPAGIVAAFVAARSGLACQRPAVQRRLAGRQRSGRGDRLHRALAQRRKIPGTGPGSPSRI